MAMPSDTPASEPTRELRGGGRTLSIDSPAWKLKRRRGLKIIRRYMLVSGSVGLIPVPFFDQVLLAGTLTGMISELCENYGTKIAKHKVKTLATAVLGGAHSEWIAHYLLRYLEKYLPAAGGVGRIVTRPIISMAITYAIGMLFIHHFDQGAWVRKALPPVPGATPHATPP